MPEVPPAVEQALLRALSKDPSHRFPTISEFARALTSAAVAVISGETAAEGQRPTSIAVLPFVNASPSTENEYFSDGITDELINALGRLDGLRVASRTSTFALQDAGADVREMIAARRFKELEPVLQKMLDEKPKWAWGWYALGYAAFAQHRLADSIKALAKSLELDAGNAEAHNLLGRNLMMVGRFDSRASSTMAGRLNLLWSAASHTSRECSMMVCATLTSR